MKSALIIKFMTNLINKKFYKTEEEATVKLDIYFAMDKISYEEYEELYLLAKSVYEPIIEE